MNGYFEDHGLPLVQLKEQRREMIVALTGCKEPISRAQMAEIAAVQSAISAIEAVIVDLDAEIDSVFLERKDRPWIVA